MARIEIFLCRMDQYCTTLAHKANHSFSPNTRWGRLGSSKVVSEVPFMSTISPLRFGKVVTLIALRSIQKEEEVTVNYKYPVTIAPQWYRDCHINFYKGKYVKKIY